MTQKIALSCIASFTLGCAGAAATSAQPDALDTGFAELVERIGAVESHIRSAPAYGSDVEQAAGYMHLARTLIWSLEAEVLQDRDYPYFRTMDFWLRAGGDNPDQRYAFSPVRGGATYRIWGNLGSARRMEVQLYAGEPWDGTGHSAGYLVFEDISVDANGAFDIVLSDEERSGTWLRNPPDATTVFVRHIYDDWNGDTPGDVHIDRVGYEGKRRPAETADVLGARFRAAADAFEKAGKTWPDFVRRRYVEAGPANTLSPLIDTYPLGGAKGRWMSTGHYDVPAGKALLIETRPTRAAYQGLQLTDLWFQSLEHANQVSSLTTSQSLLSPDGAYYFVVSAEDPGHANWLDPGAFTRGTLLLRYDGVRDVIPEAAYPKSELIDLTAVAERIPGFARVSESDREAVRRARRHHLQLRSGR